MSLIAIGLFPLLPRSKVGKICPDMVNHGLRLCRTHTETPICVRHRTMQIWTLGVKTDQHRHENGTGMQGSARVAP